MGLWHRMKVRLGLEDDWDDEYYDDEDDEYADDGHDDRLGVRLPSRCRTLPVAVRLGRPSGRRQAS